MKKRTAFTCLVLGLALIGCSDKESEKTVDYYMQRPDEREVHIEDCINKYGQQLRNAPNSCETAQTARQKAFYKDARKIFDK